MSSRIPPNPPPVNSCAPASKPRKKTLASYPTFTALSSNITSKVLQFADYPLNAKLVCKKWRDSTMSSAFSKQLLQSYRSDPVIAPYVPSNKELTVAEKVKRTCQSVLMEAKEKVSAAITLKAQGAWSLKQLISRIEKADEDLVQCFSRIVIASENMKSAFRKMKLSDKAAFIRKWMKVNQSELHKIGFLNFEGLNLTAVPPEIFKSENNVPYFKNIRELYLGSNNIEELPSEIGNLSNLQMLCVEKNQLRELPEEIGRLIHLETLDLDHNRLSNLPKAIANCRILASLQLNNNRFTYLPDEICELTRLESLDVSSNKLTKLPKNFNYLIALWDLDLKGNPFIEDPKKILENMPSLKKREPDLPG